MNRSLDWVTLRANWMDGALTESPQRWPDQYDFFVTIRPSINTTVTGSEVAVTLSNYSNPAGTQFSQLEWRVGQYSAVPPYKFEAVTLYSERVQNFTSVVTLPQGIAKLSQTRIAGSE